MSSNHKPDRGQIAARLLIGLAFVSLLAGAAVPAARQQDHAGQAREIVDLVERVERAVERHERDTGRLAIEVAAESAEDLETSSSFHRLSMQQRYEGWKGPYLEHPLTVSENPMRQSIALLSRDRDLRERGFNVNARRGFGQYLVLEGISRHTAHLVERALDPNIEDDPRAWRQKGRVQWQEEKASLLVDLSRD
jgi:hypothetical protein